MEKQATFAFERTGEASTATGVKTTVQIYTKYFTALKYFGIFPFITIFKPVKDGSIDGHERIVSRLQLHRITTGGWWWLSVGILAFVWGHCAFEIYQITRTLAGVYVDVGDKTELALGQSGWILIGSVAIVVLTIFWQKGNEFCRFLSDWNDVEQEIYSKCKCKELRLLL